MPLSRDFHPCTSCLRGKRVSSFVETKDSDMGKVLFYFQLAPNFSPLVKAVKPRYWAPWQTLCCQSRPGDIAEIFECSNFEASRILES